MAGYMVCWPQDRWKQVKKAGDTGPIRVVLGSVHSRMPSIASVKEGDVVTQGQAIGITGSTGISNGAHLHYEITEGGSRIDPLLYLPGYIQAW